MLSLPRYQFFMLKTTIQKLRDSSIGEHYHTFYSLVVFQALVAADEPFVSNLTAPLDFGLLDPSLSLSSAGVGPCSAS